MSIDIDIECAVVYYLQCNSLARFGAVSRRRCTRRNSDDCAILMIGPDGPCDVAGRGPVAGLAAASERVAWTRSMARD